MTVPILPVPAWEEDDIRGTGWTAVSQFQRSPLIKTAHQVSTGAGTYLEVQANGALQIFWVKKTPVNQPSR